MDQVQLPAAEQPFTADWVQETVSKLTNASHRGAEALQQVLPADRCIQLLERCQRLLHVEPTLLEVRGLQPFRNQPRCSKGGVAANAAMTSSAFATKSSLKLTSSKLNSSPSIHLLLCAWVQISPPADAQVVVVGDTHGQFHDVCRM
jgi:hypothetical protein